MSIKMLSKSNLNMKWLTGNGTYLQGSKKVMLHLPIGHPATAPGQVHTPDQARNPIHSISMKIKDTVNRRQKSPCCFCLNKSAMKN